MEAVGSMCELRFDDASVSICLTAVHVGITIITIVIIISPCWAVADAKFLWLTATLNKIESTESGHNNDFNTVLQMYAQNSVSGSSTWIYCLAGRYIYSHVNYNFNEMRHEWPLAIGMWLYVLTVLRYMLCENVWRIFIPFLYLHLGRWQLFLPQTAHIIIYEYIYFENALPFAEAKVYREWRPSLVQCVKLLSRQLC